MSPILVKARIQWGRIVGVTLLAFFFVEIAVAFERKFVLQHQIGARLTDAQTELDRLQKENLELKSEKEALYHPEKIEQLARERLGLTKPNEIPVKIIRNDSQHAPPEQSSALGSSKKLWFKMKEAVPLKWLLKSGRS